VLLEARQKADRLFGGQDTGAASAVAIEREFEDATVRADREAADQTLEMERVETARILARLLPAERDETDGRLHAERVRSDDALANRDDFLGIVAHELRDALGGVVLSTGVISRIAGDTGHAASIGAEVARIQRHSARANRLIGDLVDVASIDAGRLSMAMTRGNVHTLLAEAVDEFGPTAAVKGIELSIEDDGSRPAASFDHARLFQVIGNLVVNAIKFSSRGGRITLRADIVGNDVRVSVRDHGVGIAADQLESVFNRFVQVDQNDRRGLGLGLYIAKRIVLGHSGRIWAESTPGQGTTVNFTIPALR
jgi:signal transduction histidine kinase